MQYRGTEMLSVTNDNGMIRVFEANSGEEIMDIPRYLLSVQVGPFVEFKAAAHCTAQYAVDLPIGKNSHIGSSWYHPRLMQEDTKPLLSHEQSGTFVCKAVVSSSLCINTWFNARLYATHRAHTSFVTCIEGRCIASPWYDLVRLCV